MGTTAYQFASGWKIDRGRSYELDKTATGTASIDVVDTEGLLDPTNSTSPLFGTVLPMKQTAIALQNPITNAWSTRFRGYVDQYSYTVDISEKTMTTSISCVDLMELLANTEVIPGGYGTTPPAGSEGNAFYASQRVDDRIRAALSDARIPTSLWGRIFTGNVDVQDTVYAPRSQILSVIQDAADAEFPGLANFFIDANGNAVFHGRLARENPTNPQYGIQHWYAGDTAACVANPSTYAPISSLQFDQDAKKIYNAVLATPQGVASTDIAGQEASDATSIGEYGTRSISFENLITLGHVAPNTDTALVETKKYASYYVDNYAQPQTRISQVTFRAIAPGAPYAAQLWDILCGVEISDLMTITTTHPGGGGFSAVDHFVEGIHYDVDNLGVIVPNVTLTLDLSPRAYYNVNPGF